jgi:hypothetical protein
MWLKALVPVNRMKKAGVQSLLRWIKDSKHPWAQ